MKNQYFGDINDYRKYGLLRCFAEAGWNIGVCWMRTHDGGSQDGQTTSYLQNPARWRAFDPDLFDFLADRVRRSARNVRELQDSGLLSNTRYFPDRLDDAALSRAIYMASALRALTPADLLFFDPDNGLEVASVRYGTRGSARYLCWRDVEQAWQTGSSLLLFQHYSREPRTVMVGRLSTELVRRTSPAIVAAIHTSHVVFLFAGQTAHSARFAAASQLIASRWTGEIAVAAHPTDAEAGA